MKNSDKGNARIEHDRALQRVIVEMLTDHTELFKQFSDNPGLKNGLAIRSFLRRTSNLSTPTRLERKGFLLVMDWPHGTYIISQHYLDNLVLSKENKVVFQREVSVGYNIIGGRICSSLIWQIISDHADAVSSVLESRFPSAVASAVRIAIFKLLRCGTAEGGFLPLPLRVMWGKAYGVSSLQVPFCPTCGLGLAAKAATGGAVSMLNVEHQHLTFSVPSELRPLLFMDRSLLRIVAKAASAAAIHAMVRDVRRMLRSLA